ALHLLRLEPLRLEPCRRVLRAGPERDRHRRDSQRDPPPHRFPPLPLIPKLPRTASRIRYVPWRRNGSPRHAIPTPLSKSWTSASSAIGSSTAVSSASPPVTGGARGPCGSAI